MSTIANLQADLYHDTRIPKRIRLSRQAYDDMTRGVRWVNRPSLPPACTVFGIPFIIDDHLFPGMWVKEYE